MSRMIEGSKQASRLFTRLFFVVLQANWTRAAWVRRAAGRSGLRGVAPPCSSATWAPTAAVRAKDLASHRTSTITITTTTTRRSRRLSRRYSREAAEAAAGVAICLAVCIWAEAALEALGAASRQALAVTCSAHLQRRSKRQPPPPTTSSEWEPHYSLGLCQTFIHSSMYILIYLFFLFIIETISNLNLK